jgi:hypothetical protein
MATKKTNPWVDTTDRMPSQGERVLIDYWTTEKKTFLCVGHFDGQTGWWLHGTMQLPHGWKVWSWMPIPTNEPF